MSKRALFTLIVAASAIPSFSTGGTMEALVGIQPEVVQEIQAAQRSLEDGQFDLAAAQANLILLSRPLRVSVTFNDVPRRQVKDCEHALGDAIDMWQRATDGETRFERARDGEQADVRIAFEPDVVDRGVPVGGLVSWRRAIEYVNQIPTDETTAEIRVRTHNPWARGMSFEQMRHEVAHELGHVLGLDDSRRLGAVMSPLDLRRPVGKVGDDELEALHRLRDLAAEVRREALEYAMRV